MRLVELALEVEREFGGLVPRRELLAAGAAASTIDRARHAGVLVRLHAGLYRLRAPSDVAALAGAALRLRGTASHAAAAVLHGFETVGPASPTVTLPRNRRYRGLDAICIFRRTLSVDDWTIVHGVRITTPLRTVLDCCRDLPLRDAVVIADSALRAGAVTAGELRSAASSATGRRSARLRRAVALVDPRSGSVLESLLRVLLIENGLVPDVTQAVICDSAGVVIARVDFLFRLARLIVEADGFEFHAKRADWRRDLRRANAYEALGYRLLRFSWDDVLHDPDYVVGCVRAVQQQAAA